MSLVAVPAPVAAHPETMPALVNRYITLLPLGNQLEVDVVLLYGTIPAQEQRRTMDADGDSALSDTEVAAERKRWAERADEMLTLQIDGRKHRVAFDVAVDLNGRMKVGGEPLLVQMRGHVPLSPGEHTFLVDAGPDLPRMGETEMVLEPGHPWLLHAGVLPSGQTGPAQTSIKYPGPRAYPAEPRHAGFVIRSHGPLDSATPGPSVVIPGLLVGFSILLGAALMLVVRRMERKHRKRGPPT